MAGILSRNFLYLGNYKINAAEQDLTAMIFLNIFSSPLFILTKIKHFSWIKPKAKIILGKMQYPNKSKGDSKM